jgi:hypothetical protein
VVLDNTGVPVALTNGVTEAWPCTLQKEPDRAPCPAPPPPGTNPSCGPGSNGTSIWCVSALGLSLVSVLLTACWRSGAPTIIATPCCNRLEPLRTATSILPFRRRDGGCHTLNCFKLRGQEVDTHKFRLENIIINFYLALSFSLLQASSSTAATVNGTCCAEIGSHAGCGSCASNASPAPTLGWGGGCFCSFDS